MSRINLSIIVVSLNTKNKFIKTIQSINSQTYNNYEIIIVDGKSTDGTIEEILKIKNFFLKYLIENDKGIYDAMNKGIHLASGNWVIFLNSGDVFCNRNVLKNIFKISALEKKDIIFGNTYVKNYNLKYFIKSKKFSNKTNIMPFCHQSTLVKTPIIKKNKFSLKYKYSSDFNFFYKCFLNNKFFYDSNLSIATVEANGLSDKNRNKVYNENIQILKKYNYNLFLIVNLWLLKLVNSVKCCFKFILPSPVINWILKFKYYKFNL
jgi:glycosyltransferase involved in cell wall biosynthesis